MTNKLLEGLRVIDLSRVMSGPYCTALLADLGAEVIKVETPESGDDSRRFGPFVDGDSVYFSLLNRGKKSITLNLKDARAQALLLQLVETADVVVENFRPGVATRLGLDYERLRACNPRLVYLSISGFGQDSDYRARPAYDLVIQAMSGMMSTTGRPDQEPTCVGESIADVGTGLYGAWALMASLFARERDGQGRHVELSMFDTMLALQLTGLSRLFATGQAPQRVGNRHPVTVPVDCYPSRDGWVVIVVSHDQMFRRFAELIGHPDWADDTRYRDNRARAAHEPELKAAISAWTSDRTVDEIVAQCLTADIPAGPVWDLQRAFGWAQQQGRAVVAPAADGQPWPFVWQPAVFGEGGAPAARDPRLGEHNDEILAGLGVGAEEREQLRAGGVI